MNGKKGEIGSDPDVPEQSMVGPLRCAEHHTPTRMIIDDPIFYGYVEGIHRQMDLINAPCIRLKNQVA